MTRSKFVRDWCGWDRNGDDTERRYYREFGESLDALLAAVRAKERERCWREADKCSVPTCRIAAAIRALKDEAP